MIAAPHTSNADFVLMMAMAWINDLSIKWLGKEQLFRGPGGPFFRALGGISVNRGTPGALTASLVEMFNGEEQVVLAVPAEGTRSGGEYWKSGFRRIALDAGVPVLPTYLDGPSRSGGFGESITMTHDVVADMDKIREFYADKRGLRPKNFTTPRLRDEQRSLEA